MNKIRITIFTTVFVLLQSVHTHSFDLGTHRDLTERAILSSSLDNFLKTKLGLAGGINEAILNKRIRDRITEGSVREDDSPRFCNHFHNPLSNWGAAGLQIPIPTPIPIPQGCLGTINHSSVLWGQGPSLQTSNESFTWQDARTTYFEGLTAQNQSEREGKLSRTFRALGQLIHLVQDAAVPAHTRDDLHPLQSIGFLGLESFVENTRINDGDLFDQLTGSSQPFDRSILAAPPNRSAPIPIAHIIDLTDSDQLAAVPSAGTDQGMAEYSNANFLSNDTIFGRDFTFPREESLGSFFLGIEPLTLLPRIYFPKISDGETVDHFVATSTLFELLLPFGRTDLGYVLDRRVLQDYAAKLLPRAIGYSAGLLDYFFRGTLNFTVGGSGTSSELEITNTSSETMDGTFTLYADDFSGGRSPVAGASFNLTLGPGATSGPLNFTPPSQVQAYVLAFQGRLGNEDGAVAGKINEWYMVTNVTPGTITPGQATTITITIKSNFSRQPRTLVAALLDANASQLASTAVIIPNTGPTTTMITLDITSNTIPANAPRPISLVVASDVDIGSITTTDLNAQTPVDVVMNLVRVGQNSRLPIYMRGVSGELMQVAIGPGHFLFVCSVFGVNPEMVTLKYKNVKDFFIQYLAADDDFDPQLLNQGIVLNGSQTQFQTITLKLDTLVDQFGNKAVNHFLQGRGDLVDANAFVCIRSISELGNLFTKFGFGICDIGTQDFKTRECPE